MCARYKASELGNSWAGNCTRLILFSFCGVACSDTVCTTAQRLLVGRSAHDDSPLRGYRSQYKERN